MGGATSTRKHVLKTILSDTTIQKCMEVQSKYKIIPPVL